MTITPIDASAASAAAPSKGAQMISARSDTGDVAVRFAPGDGVSTALDRVGSGVLSKLKQYEAGRAARTKAVFNVTSGPANPVDAAKAELTSGPATVLGSDGPSPARLGENAQVNDALLAMTRSFDYAIETQLIVKTGSQLTTSASSMMRGG